MYKEISGISGVCVCKERIVVSASEVLDKAFELSPDHLVGEKKLTF